MGLKKKKREHDVSLSGCASWSHSTHVITNVAISSCWDGRFLSLAVSILHELMDETRDTSPACFIYGPEISPSQRTDTAGHMPDCSRPPPPSPSILSSKARNVVSRVYDTDAFKRASKARLLRDMIDARCRRGVAGTGRGINEL